MQYELLFAFVVVFTLDSATPGPVEEVGASTEGWYGFGMATILPLGNPMSVGFYAALLPAVMDVGELTFLTTMQFGTIIVVVWGGVLVGYAAMADRGRRRFDTPSGRRWPRGAAGAMVGAAGVVAARD